MQATTKDKSCECPGHCMPFCMILLISLGLSVLRGKISHQDGRTDSK